MTPEELISNLEAISHIASVLDGVKTDLESRGWREDYASQAAIMATSRIMELQVAAEMGGKRRR